MSKKRFASVWDAIEDSARDAASMKLRAELAHEIIAIGVTQPRISRLTQSGRSFKVPTVLPRAAARWVHH